jgi:hypothetical protein
LEKLSNAKGMRATILPFHNPALEVDPIIAAFAEEKKSGLIVIPTAANNVARKKIVSSSARFGIPAIYPFRQYSVEGGLISYGVAFSTCLRRVRLMWIVFSRVRSRQIFRFKPPQSTSWRST